MDSRSIFGWTDSRNATLASEAITAHQTANEKSHKNLPASVISTLPIFAPQRQISKYDNGTFFCDIFSVNRSVVSPFKCTNSLVE